MFAESGDRDAIFPTEATRYAVNRARDVFRVMDAEDRLGFEVFNGPHTFHGVGAFEQLAKLL